MAGEDILFSFFYLCTQRCELHRGNLFVYLNSEIANFKMQEVNGLERLYLDVTCRFILYWAFGDALSLWIGRVTSFLI